MTNTETKLFDRKYQACHITEGTYPMNIDDIHAELLDMTETFMNDTDAENEVSTATERRFKHLYDALNAAGVANLDAYKETLLTMGYMGYNRYSPGSYALMRWYADEHERESKG